MTDIELIEADLKSIADARRCLESMKSIHKDRDLPRDFEMVWADLQILSGRLQRKLDRLKNEGGAIVSNPKWEIGPVELIGGNEAIIDAINEDQEDFRYSGRVRSQRGIMVSTGWHANGRYMYAETNHGFNLAPPSKKKVRVQLWVNVNPESYVVYYARDTADKNAPLNRIACIEIDREVTEGEGL